MNKIVLVEDEERIRSGLKRLIEDVIGGCLVIGEAGNGKEALDLLKRRLPDLLITDIRMGEMNGIELIKRIRNEYPDLAILIISGHADFEYARQAIKSGVHDYLLKPVDRIELTQFLKEFQKTRQDKPDSAHAAGESGNSDERRLIRRVKELIAERLDQDISLQSIAEQVHLNHQYLSVLFKTQTGQNFSEFVTCRRMDKAKQLLAGTNLKVYEIARLSGYASAKHFMGVFKQQTGMTPSEYRDGADQGKS